MSEWKMTVLLECWRLRRCSTPSGCSEGSHKLVPLRLRLWYFSRNILRISDHASLIDFNQHLQAQYPNASQNTQHTSTCELAYQFLDLVSICSFAKSRLVWQQHYVNKSIWLKGLPCFSQLIRPLPKKLICYLFFGYC